MIKLDYRLSSEWTSGAWTFDLATADETVLRYQALTGDQIFLVGETDFSAPWGWVPLLDFAASLVAIARRLTSERNGLSSYDFTESEAQIQFASRDGIITISSNYSEGTAVVSFDELQYATNSYASCLLRDALKLYPSLEKNESLKDWYPVG